MDCTVATTYNPGPPPSAVTSPIKYMKKSQQQQQSSPKPQVLRVNFEPDKGEVQERKKKYLTAKYGQHQMSLIRKRLRVEMWMFDQLQSLCGQRDENSSEKSDSYDVEIDLDELLDIEGDYKRKEWLGEKVIGAKISPEDLEKFIVELLQRAKTL